MCWALSRRTRAAMVQPTDQQPRVDHVPVEPSRFRRHRCPPALGGNALHHGPVDLMLSMLPGNHDSQMNVRGPLYREWKREHVVTSDEYWSVVDSGGKMLVADAGEDPDRWASLVGHVGDLPVSARRARRRPPSLRPSGAGRRAVRDCCVGSCRSLPVRGLAGAAPDGFPSPRVQRHHWALPESELELFDPLLERLLPAAPAIAYGWLFSSNLMMVDGVRWADDHDAHGVALAAKRARVVGEILATGGIDAVVDLTETVDSPYEVGIALATQASALDIDILDAIHGASEPVTVATLTYFESRFGECGWELIDRLIADHAPPKQVVADLLRAVPAVEAPWRRADALGADVAHEYWTRVNPLELGTPPSLDQFREVSERLRKAGRAGAAIRLISRWEHRHGSATEAAEEAAACLEGWLQQQDAEDPPPVPRYELSRLVEMLDHHREYLGTGRVATLEWQYLPRLRTPVTPVPPTCTGISPRTGTSSSRSWRSLISPLPRRRETDQSLTRPPASGRSTPTVCCVPGPSGHSRPAATGNKTSTLSDSTAG